jgi:hypothetical protein
MKNIKMITHFTEEFIQFYGLEVTTIDGMFEIDDINELI